MAASSKFDLSASPDRPSYSTGQRGPYAGSSLDRSGSFRESVENPVLSSLPSMSRSSSAVTHEDVIRFFQCLRFDPKSVAADYKLHRQGEFKRILSIALGISQDDSPSASLKGRLLSSPSAEEVKKAKSFLRESSAKARDRAKIFSEALSVLNKFFPSVPSRKRSRTDLMSGDRASVVPSSDRSGLGPSMGKMGTPTHAMTNCSESELQRPEERAKGAIISKRTRTSLLDARANSVARPSMLVDKDRDVLRLASSGAVLGEERSLCIGVDGWEKSKMKKKRSGIKPDVSSSNILNKPVDVYREPRQGMHQRPVTDSRSRLNDSHGSRPVVSNGAVGVGKSDSISQQTGTSVRSSISRGDQENSSVSCDKKDRSVASDKERINLKALNKTSVREDYSSASPTSNTKVPASARAPRSSTGAFPKLSPVVHRQSASDWEISQSTNRPSSVSGPNNRKRTPSARSSSPPVAHWAGQRPQKISRTARRTNILPIVPSNDEAPPLDSTSDVIGNDSGLAVTRRFPSSSPQHVKLKTDHIASAALSESEESGVAEIKSRDKRKMFDEVDDKVGQNVPKGSLLSLPPRKNKLIGGEDLGDGVRRQGRTGRGSISARSLAPTTCGKLGNVGTAKQLRTSKMSFDKTESKAGRPPTRKLSGRKAYTRQRHTSVPATVDFPGIYPDSYNSECWPGPAVSGSDDGQAELLAAAKAVLDSSHLSSFWRFMEPIFGFIREGDLVFLKQQMLAKCFEDGHLVSLCSTFMGVGERMPTLLQLVPVSMGADNSGSIPNGFGLAEHERDLVFTPVLGTFQEKITLETRGPNGIPLCQTLIAALITEEDCDDARNEDIQVDNHAADFPLDEEWETGNLSSNGLIGSFPTVGRSNFNGFRITTVRSSLNELEGQMEPDLDSRMAAIQKSSPISSLSHSFNGLIPEIQVMGHMASPESHYDDLSMDERIMMEIQSIGIFPEQGNSFLLYKLSSCYDVLPEMRQMDSDEVNQEIRNLEETYFGQVSRKRNWIEKLLRSASGTRELQEKEYREYQQCALGQTCSHGLWEIHGLGSSFWWKGCWCEPAFKDIFHSGSNQFTEVQTVDAIMQDESARTYANALGLCQIDQNVENHNVYSASAFLSVNRSAEQNIGKEDAWSTKVKKRELLLDDVGGKTIVISGVSPSIGGTLSSNAKGKRSERDREGKGQGRDCVVQKWFNKTWSTCCCLLGRSSEQPKASFSSVPKPRMDADLGGQGQDLGSWLNIDDDGLQDHDFMGLEIPMDDLADESESGEDSDCTSTDTYRVLPELFKSGMSSFILIWVCLPLYLLSQPFLAKIQEWTHICVTAVPPIKIEVNIDILLSSELLEAQLMSADLVHSTQFKEASAECFVVSSRKFMPCRKSLYSGLRSGKAKYWIMEEARGEEGRSRNDTVEEETQNLVENDDDTDRVFSVFPFRFSHMVEEERIRGGGGTLEVEYCSVYSSQVTQNFALTGCSKTTFAFRIESGYAVPCD
ncbi:hypothetical protein Ancab_017957 [Ancistrocladus abbreviatus]